MSSWSPLSRNVGKAAAARHAATLAKEPTLVGYWDADLATPPAAVDEFIAVLDTSPESTS